MRYKQVIVLRKDLKWEKGKLATQAAHAAVGSLRKARQAVVERWESAGGKKVVLKVNSGKELVSLQRAAKREKMPNFLVRDAGRTQLEPGTITALGLGPAEENKIDKLTKKLKLF